MENNRRGTGIFLGVVAVATLIVAIIGATFAYFSITASSDADAIDLTAYEFNATLSVSQIYPVSSGALIPFDPTTVIANAQSPNNTNLLYAVNAAPNKCIDDSGFQVCALYLLTFTNGGSSSIILDGTIKTVVNTASSSGRSGATPFEDLTAQFMTGTHTSNNLETSGSAVTLAATQNDTVSIDQVTVGANSTVTRYMVVYLNEDGDQSAQMGATYNGQLIYTSTTGNGSQLTGTFTVSGG